MKRQGILYSTTTFFCKSFYYLLSAAEGRGRGIIEHLPYVRTCMRPSVRSSRFCINLNISFIYEDIFTKFAGTVYGYENLSLKNFSLILKNKMATIANCLKIVKVLLNLEIFQLASSNLHKSYMARKASLIVIFFRMKIQFPF